MCAQTSPLRVLVLALGLFAGLGPALSAAEEAGGFQELLAVCGPLKPFVAENRVAADVGGAWLPLPADAAMRAYEEHGQFVSAVGETAGEPAVCRRFFCLKPGLFVVDDAVAKAPDGSTLQWAVWLRGEPQAAGRQLRCSADGQECVCETAWPADKTFQRGPRDNRGVRFDLPQTAVAGGARWLHVLQVRRTADEAAVKTSLAPKDGTLELTLTTAERTFRLTLPPPGTDAGWIAIQGNDGKWLVPPRPLASGVLPHGPDGSRMLERWDSAYREGRVPGWDTGAPAPELKRVVEAGIIKPCRTVTWGCGTGASDIYLAGKGFDVTAIDVAPTALAIAQQQAEKAGVRVRWVLADVLKLPDLGQFDFLYDRGCYHHVRHVDAAATVEAICRLSHPGTRALILSCDGDAPPGVREHHMREDFSKLFEFEWLRDSGVENRDGTLRRASWSLMMRRKE
jgi:SAM-dependent methyltransferase